MLCDYEEYLPNVCGVPELNFWVIKANSNMTTLWIPVDTGDWAFIIIHSDKLWCGAIWCIPQVNSVSKSNCKDIAATPIQQVQAEIVYEIRGIQCTLRGLPLGNYDPRWEQP